jgi:hypothetical protein
MVFFFAALTHAPDEWNKKRALKELVNAKTKD